MMHCIMGGFHVAYTGDGARLCFSESINWLACRSVSWLPNRRIAYVEPTDEKGRSRWIGDGQFLSFRVCQAIRRVLTAETTEPYWSQRATAQIGEIRLEYLSACLVTITKMLIAGRTEGPLFRGRRGAITTNAITCRIKRLKKYLTFRRVL